MANQDIRFIDLFAGIGGFRMSFDRCGCKCVFSSEFNEACQNVYEQNYGDRPSGDITLIDEKDIPDFDILCAGFPCQPFSICGKKMGFNDTRGTLFFYVCRIIKEKQPKKVSPATRFKPAQPLAFGRMLLSTCEKQNKC